VFTSGNAIKSTENGRKRPIVGEAKARPREDREKAPEEGKKSAWLHDYNKPGEGGDGEE